MLIFSVVKGGTDQFQTDIIIPPGIITLVAHTILRERQRLFQGKLSHQKNDPEELKASITHNILKRIVIL
jgi:hypothetical protein